MARFDMMEEPTGRIPDAQDMVKVLWDELRVARMSMMQDIYNRHSGEVISRSLLDSITAEIEDTFSRQLMMPGDCDMHMAVQCFVARAMASRLQNPDWLYEYMDDAHEKDPEPVYYVAKEVSDWKLKNICDSAKYAEKLKARVKERWEAKQKASKQYREWKAELIAKGMTESDLPLSKRMFPPLLGEPTLADMYHYCMFDGDDMEPKWEAERKIAHELADKAWELENLTPDGFVKVRPMTNYENIYYSLRYLYDQPDTDIRNRAQRRHG